MSVLNIGAGEPTARPFIKYVDSEHPVKATHMMGTGSIVIKDCQSLDPKPPATLSRTLPTYYMKDKLACLERKEAGRVHQTKFG